MATEQEEQKQAAVPVDSKPWVKITSAEAAQNGPEWVVALRAEPGLATTRYGTEVPTNTCEWRNTTVQRLFISELSNVHRDMRAWHVENGGAALLWDVFLPDGTPCVPHKLVGTRVPTIVLKNPRPVPDEVYERAVKHHYDAFRQLPKDKHTPAIIRAALHKHGSNLRYICSEKRTPEVCELAVRSSGRALSFVPPALRTDAMRELAVRNDGCSLQFVEPEHRTRALNVLAMENTLCAIPFVPVDMQEEMATSAIEQDPWLIFDLDKSIRTPVRYVLAVQQDPDIVEDIPDDEFTEAIGIAAVQADVDALALISEDVCTEAVCLLAVQQDGRALKRAPLEFRTSSVCSVAVQQDARALQFVPEALRTSSLCRAAIRQVLGVVAKARKAMDDAHWKLKGARAYARRAGEHVLEHVPDHLKEEVAAFYNESKGRK